MSFIRIALEGNIKNFDANLHRIAKESGRSYLGLWGKFVSDFARYQCSYSDFVNFKYYAMTPEQKEQYVSVRHSDRFYSIVSPAKYKTFFTIKPNFLKNFKKYITREYFCDEGLEREKGIEKLRGFLERHPVFIEKPIDGLGGRNVKKRSSADVGDVAEYYDRVVSEPLLLEELIVQHEGMNAICPESCNTIRVMTFASKDKSRILFAAMRCGNGSSAVDNFHQGGMTAMVDLETGKLSGNAINQKGEWFERHPETGLHFDGYQIPNWDVIKKTVLEAALVNQKIHVVGWDVAVTPDGCTFVEGNRRPGFDVVQATSKRGRKDIMLGVLAELNADDGTNYRL